MMDPKPHTSKSRAHQAEVAKHPTGTLSIFQKEGEIKTFSAEQKPQISEAQIHIKKEIWRMNK